MTTKHIKMHRYYWGTYQDFLDIQNGTHVGVGEFHFFCGTDPSQPVDPIFIVMRSGDGVPHPNWKQGPHVLSTKYVKQHFTALPPTPPQLVIGNNDAMFDVAMAAHALMPVFEP